MNGGARFAGCAAAGVLLGVAGARWVLVGSGLSLIPWGLLALLIGASSRSRTEALSGGAGYGFALAYAFMVAGYDGSAPLAGRLAPFVLLGLFGAVCGATLALVGRRVPRPSVLTPRAARPGSGFPADRPPPGPARGGP